jgi:hypothetical protein
MPVLLNPAGPSRPRNMGKEERSLRDSRGNSDIVSMRSLDSRDATDFGVVQKHRKILEARDSELRM